MQDTGCTLFLCVVSAFDFIICFASCLLCRGLAVHYLCVVSAFDFYNLFCLLPFVQDTGCTLLLCVVSAFDFIICFASCLLCRGLAVHYLCVVSAFDFIICFASCLLCRGLAVHYFYVLCQPLIL